MKGPRLRLVRPLLGLVLAPPLLWAAILWVIPTGWAKALLVERLRQATGQAVRLEGLRFRALGGVRLRNLEIGAAAQDPDPWLRVEDLRVDLNLAQLLTGRLRPREAEAAGLFLRVRRHRDGSLEFGDLLGGAPDPSAVVARRTTAPVPSAVATCRTADAAPVAAREAPGATPDRRRDVLEFRVRDARVLVLDEPSATRLEFDGVEGGGTWEPGRAAIRELHGRLNGGRFDLVAQLDRGPDAPAFEGELRAEGVVLGVGMNALGYLVPILSGARASLDGRLDLDLYVRSRGSSAREIRETLTGQGTIALDPIRLDDSRIVAELATLVPLPAAGRVGSVRSDFAIGGQRVASKNLTLTVAQMPIVLSGCTDFQGRLDYRVKAEDLSGHLSAEARGLLADLPIDLDSLMALRVQGTVTAPELTLDGVSLAGRDPARRADDRARIREFTRRLRDRLLR
jgi:hypothetical protein